ncbi:hypothetical protein [Streptomyces echinatus]|uniref:hypothetical protein n=1 Tax=Streptomyces echinatus TaxID=67293 RepID=UPI0037A564DF
MSDSEGSFQDDKDLLQAVRARPGMYGLDGTYYPTVTFLIGYDFGRSGRLLRGFDEWLVARRGEETSLDWGALVLEDAFPGSEIRHWSQLTEGQQRRSVDHLFTLLLAFLSERGAA